MQPWFKREPSRFKDDRKELEAIGFKLDEEKLDNENLVEYRGRSAKYPERELILTFPSGYPSESPKCKDDGSQPLLIRHHRAFTRDFCIFGRNASRWEAGDSPVKAIKEVEELIRDYSDSSNLPDAEQDPAPEPISPNLPYKENFFALIPPPISQLISDGFEEPDDGIIRVKTGKTKLTKDTHINRAVICKISLKKANDAIQAHPIFRNYIDPKNSNGIKGKLYYLPTKIEPPVTFDSLKELAQDYGFKVPPSSPWYGFIVKEESGHRLKERNTLLLFHQPKKSSPYPLRTMPLQNSSTNIRIPGLEWLDQKKIAVIGCGAIGSKMTVELASTGLSDFVLIDPDHIEPDNAIRHEAGPLSFGLPKVIALRNEIFRKNPEAKVTAISARFGDSTNSCEEQLFDEINSCDLIVNATGNDHTSRYINEVCCDLKKPAIHVSVTNGAWSGEAVRVIPDITPCWMCWDDQYKDHSPAGEPVDGHGIYAAGCDQPTFTGTIYDISRFASVATSFAVDTLGIANGNKPKFENHYLLWENFDEHGQPVLKGDLKPVKYRSSCVFCNS